MTSGQKLFEDMVRHKMAMEELEHSNLIEDLRRQHAASTARAEKAERRVRELEQFLQDDLPESEAWCKKARELLDYKD